MSTGAQVRVIDGRWRDAGLVALGALAAFALGVLGRLWMRLIAVRPEFSWGGTLGIVIGFTIFGLTESCVALARRRRWRPWAARVARCTGIIGMLPLFVAAGGQMMPTVVFGGLAAWRTDWPRIARVACVPVAALPVLFVGHGIVDDFGWSLRSLAGVAGLLGLYGVIVWATRPTMTRPTTGWPPPRRHRRRYRSPPARNGEAEQMPVQSGPSPRPIPRPRTNDNVRLVRKLFSDPPVALDEISAAYGPICALGSGPMRVVVIGGPELIQQLFAASVGSFRWAHKFNVIGLRFVIGRTSMIVSDGADHDRRRAPAQPAFARRRLNDWIPMILGRTDAAIDQLFTEVPADGGATVDMYPVGRRLILGITLRALLGERFSAQVDEIGDLYVRPQRFIEAPAVKQLPHPMPFTFRAKVRADRRAIDRLIDAEIVVRRQDPAGEAPDVLDAYLGSELSDVEIRDQIRSLIGAGYDTTAATFAWMVLCAASTPGVWARLRAEADDVLGPTDQRPPVDPDSAVLTNLVFAGRVVHEALRLHPAGLLGVRAAGTDVHLGDYLIRRGTLIAWSPYLAGRDPASWVEPLRFNPDRFADLTPVQKALSDQAWLPFGRGPHSCLGFALAQMELTLILARLAQRLDLTSGRAVLPRPLGMIVNRPEGGANLRVSHPVSG